MRRAKGSRCIGGTHTQGALLFETWAGDPRPVPADKEGYYALLKERGIVRLPNPAFRKPDTAPKQPQDGKDLYS